MKFILVFLVILACLFVGALSLKWHQYKSGWNKIGGPPYLIVLRDCTERRPDRLFDYIRIRKEDYALQENDFEILHMPPLFFVVSKDGRDGFLVDKNPNNSAAYIFKWNEYWIDLTGPLIYRSDAKTANAAELLTMLGRKVTSFRQTSPSDPDYQKIREAVCRSIPDFRLRYEEASSLIRNCFGTPFSFSISETQLCNSVH